MRQCLPYIRKQANVTPMFKNKGGFDVPSSYRPISLTSSFCKITSMELRENIVQICLITLKTMSYYQNSSQDFSQRIQLFTNEQKLIKLYPVCREGKDTGIPFIFCDISVAFNGVSFVNPGGQVIGGNLLGSRRWLYIIWLIGNKEQIFIYN